MKTNFIKHGDGHADITLSRTLEVNGAKLSTVRMREPTVGDQLASARSGGSDADQELSLVANLTELTPEDLHRLPLRDYQRVKTALLGFLD